MTQLGKLTLAELQARGWVTQTKQYSGGIGWGYKILRYNPAWGQMTFSSSIYSQEQLEDEQTQINLFHLFQQFDDSNS